MYDLISTTEEVHYETYRANRLKQSSDINVDPTTMSQAREKFVASLKTSEQKFRDRLAERVKLEDLRFRQWEQRLVNERARLTKNLESEHSGLKALAREVENLESRVNQSTA
jgi:cell division control protein 12